MRIEGTTEKSEKYILTLNHNQTAVLRTALEEYFRLRLNQWRDLADSLVFDNMTAEAWNDKGNFDRALAERNMAEDVFRAVGNALNNEYFPRKRTQDELIAQDVWEVIRHEMWKQKPKTEWSDWCVDSREPMQSSDEPLPRIEVVKNG